MKELFLETEEPLSMKLPACWEFHLGQSLAFLKTVWKCIGLQPNFCPACQLKSRRRAVSAHARTFLIGWKESQHFFQRYHRWWGMGIWARHNSQAAFVLLEIFTLNPYIILLESLSNLWAPDKFDEIWRACSLFSSTFIELYIMNFVVQGQTVNHRYYTGTLSCPWGNTLQNNMKTGIQRIGVPIMMPVCDLLAKNKMAAFPHPPSSIDLAPCDFLLLPELNTALKGRGGSDISFLQAELWNRLSKFQTVNFANASNIGAFTGLTK